MAGHSHWAGIKHKKALVDNKRGKLWSKLSKAIIVAAKIGGKDLETNVRLRTAINDAKAVSMPKDNIDRAVKKGVGELEGGNVDEILYEGYGPSGVAVMCDIMTDNRNRTAPEVRKLFEAHGGKLGSTNCVSYLFERKGLIIVNGDDAEEEQLMEIALENGAEDVKSESGKFEIHCEPESFTSLCEAIDAAEIETEVREIARIPTNTVDLDAAAAQKVFKLMEALDDHDDVQNVSANFNIPDDAMEND
ncbi:MAG: YebC/PmpR family DNA-binding regulatory protein [Pirellulaceae bacterium]|jgi:YebC/PmpR family DNA-binding regulatory protein